MALFAIMWHVHELKITEGYAHVLILPKLRVHTQPMLVNWRLLVVTQEVQVLLRNFEQSIVLSLSILSATLVELVLGCLEEDSALLVADLAWSLLGFAGAVD